VCIKRRELMVLKDLLILITIPIFKLSDDGIRYIVNT